MRAGFEFVVEFTEERIGLLNPPGTTSGVKRAGEGVPGALRGSIEGDLDSGRGSTQVGGGKGRLEMMLTLCDLGMAESRFNLLVSVGLMVLAPRPVA